VGDFVADFLATKEMGRDRHRLQERLPQLYLTDCSGSPTGLAQQLDDLEEQIHE